MHEQNWSHDHYKLMSLGFPRLDINRLKAATNASEVISETNLRCTALTEKETKRQIYGGLSYISILYVNGTRIVYSNILKHYVWSHSHLLWFGFLREAKTGHTFMDNVADGFASPNNVVLSSKGRAE